MAYIGDYNSLDINSDSIKGEEMVTIYYLDDIGGNAFLDKMAIRKLLKQIDPELKFNSAVPARIEFKNNRAKYLEGSSFSDL